MKSILIPDDLHQALKEYCVKNKTSIITVITNSINQAIGTNIVANSLKGKLTKTTDVLLPKDTQVVRTTYPDLSGAVSKYPAMYMGKPLSGRTATCPICHDVVPVEFATKHYSDTHEDL